MAFSIFKKKTKAKAEEVNGNFTFIAGNRLIAINPSTGIPILDFNIGDLGAIATGSLVGDILARSGKSIEVYNSSGTPIGSVTYDDLLTLQQATTITIGQAYLPKAITIANSIIDPDHDMVFSAGVFQFSDGTGQAVAIEKIKQLDVDFALGSNAGGMPATVTKTGTYSTTGTSVSGAGSAFDTDFKVGDILWSSTEGAGRKINIIADATNMTISSAFGVDVPGGEAVEKNGLAPNATYHNLLISNSDGSIVDAGYDTQPNAENLLADTTVSGNSITKYSKNSSLITDGSANIRNGSYTFNSDGSYIFNYNLGLLEISTTSPATVRLAVPMAVPPNAFVKLNIKLLDNDPTSAAIIFTEEGQDDVVPTGANATVFSSSNWLATVQDYFKTNASSEVFYRSNDGGASIFDAFNKGWMDNNLQ